MLARSGKEESRIINRLWMNLLQGFPTEHNDPEISPLIAPIAPISCNFEAKMSN
jgi:hypothetical protein